MSAKARRSKSLDIEMTGDDRLSFSLSLEDKALAPGSEEVIHALEIEGDLSLPELEIIRIEPRVIHHPYAECAASVAPVRQMLGTRLGPGFRARVLEVMGGTRGCTHFTTLMLDLGAAHTLSLFVRMRKKVPRTAPPARGAWMRAGLELEPRLQNACIALQSNSPPILDALEADPA